MVSRVWSGLALLASSCGSGHSQSSADAAAGDATAGVCDWAASPQLAWSLPGAAPSTVFANGDTVFSGWLEGGVTATGTDVVATRVPDLQSRVVVHRAAFMTLLGASDEGIYVGESDENGTWTSLELLHGDGSLVRQIDPTIGGQPIAGPQLRVGATLYVIAGNALYAEHQGMWSALAGVGAVTAFAQTNGPLLVVGASRTRVCVVDEATQSAQPCVDMPATLDGTTQVYSIDRAVFAAGQWALLVLTDSGEAIVAGSGATWQTLAVTNNQWIVNDLAPRANVWMWLRQDAVDQNTFRTSAMVAGPNPLWVVDGQAFQLASTRCGPMFAVANSGIYAVAP